MCTLPISILMSEAFLFSDPISDRTLTLAFVRIVRAKTAHTRKIRGHSHFAFDHCVMMLFIDDVLCTSDDGSYHALYLRDDKRTKMRSLLLRGNCKCSEFPDIFCRVFRATRATTWFSSFTCVHRQHNIVQIRPRSGASWLSWSVESIVNEIIDWLPVLGPSGWHDRLHEEPIRISRPESRSQKTLNPALTFDY